MSVILHGPERPSGRARALKFLAAAMMALAALAVCSCGSGKPKELVVWTYDSFVSEWGPGAKLAELYKEKTGKTVTFVAKGDGGALLGVLLSDSKRQDVDLVIGLDDQLIDRALASGMFAETHLSDIGNIPSNLVVDPKNRLVPYDFGYFAFIWDSQSGIEPPASLEDLTKPEYRKKIILMDPRTSTPGLGFLAWTQAVYGDGWQDYWKRLAPSVLAMPPGWDTGYGLFTKGEAPLVLSYATSPAYHKAYENSERYKTLVFAEGHTAQIELAGVIARSRNRKEAEAFLSFLISNEAQEILPETQWMYPADSNAKLPDSFSVVPSELPLLKAKIADPDKDPDTAAAILSGASN